MLMVSLIVREGDSGGVICNAAGELVGVISGPDHEITVGTSCEQRNAVSLAREQTRHGRADARRSPGDERATAGGHQRPVVLCSTRSLSNHALPSPGMMTPKLMLVADSGTSSSII